MSHCYWARGVIRLIGGVEGGKRVEGKRVGVGKGTKEERTHVETSGGDFWSLRTDMGLFLEGFNVERSTIGRA